MKKTIFRDCSVIITGASSGIGRAVALALADAGASLALAARNGKRLEQVVQQCIERGGQAICIPTDVSSEEQCQTLIERTVAEYKQLDMLVSNAGMGQVSMLADLPNLSQFKQVIDVNFMGAVYCTYHALPHLVQSRGRIVAVSSLAGKIALPGNTSYVASKHALQGFCDALRMEMALVGVSVTVISPYWVVTEFHEAMLDKKGTPRGKQGRAIYTRNMMTAERCAKIALEAAYKRRREVLMGPGRLLVWLKLISPGFLDWLSIKAILEPIIRRSQAGKIEA